jgi:hypothetical protein
MRKATPSTSVGFRASPDLLRLIDRERERFGVSRGQWARGAISSLLFGERENTMGALEELRTLVEQSYELSKAQNLRLAAALYTILTEVGQMDANDAKAMVRRRILSKGDSE